MQLTRSKKVILGTVLAIAILSIGIYSGILPGKRSKEKLPEVKLTVWGTLNEYETFNEPFNGYAQIRPNVTITYEKIDPEHYEQTLINALAAGKGPDVFMFKNTWLPTHYDKIIPAGENQLAFTTFQSLFPKAVEQDFAPDKLIYALPLSIDTLALYYNEDIFDGAAIALPPKDWLAFQNDIPKLRQLDKSGNFIRAGAAIGGSNNTISNGSDILTSLMLQNGTRMTNDEFTNATFAGAEDGLFTGLDALDFYVKFSDPADTYYTWNESMENSLDTFAKGRVGMVFGYLSDKKTIKSKNPFLRFKAAPLPQPSDASAAVNTARYWGLAVSNHSQTPEWAWDLILYLATNEAAAEKYMNATGESPALRTLIQKYAEDPNIGVFAKQALTARSWPLINEQLVTSTLSTMIHAVATKKLDSRTAISQAEEQITAAMQARRK